MNNSTMIMGLVRHATPFEELRSGESREGGKKEGKNWNGPGETTQDKGIRERNHVGEVDIYLIINMKHSKQHVLLLMSMLNFRDNMDVR